MREKIKDILKRVLKLEIVKDDISQKNCDKWDSLSHLNIIVELETEFDITIEPEDLIEMKSLEVIELKLRKLQVCL